MRSLPLLLLAACQSPEEDDTATPPLVDGGDTATPLFSGESVEWTPDCIQPGVDCATVEVPYDHADPGSRTFPMLISRVKHRSNTNYKGVILTNPGGPGVDGNDFTFLFADIFGDLAVDYDVIGFAPRGSGTADSGEPFGCAADAATWDAVWAAYNGSTDPQSVDALIAAQAEVFAACRASNPDLVDHMGMSSWADDMETIREALGVETINYYGASGGSALGMAYADRHPEHTGRFVLDSNISPYGGGFAWNDYQGRSLSEYLDLWADWCAGREECLVRDDPHGAIEAVVERAKTDPLTVGDRHLTWGLAVNGIVSHFYSETSWGYLDDGLALAMDGDAAYLLSAADGNLGRLGGRTASYDPFAPVYYHTLCGDNRTPATAADVIEWVEGESELGSQLAMFELSWCAAFPAPVDPYPRAPTAEGAPPMLMLQSTLDAATSLEAALDAQAGFTNGTVMMLLEGKNHVVINQSECIRGAAVAYFLDGTLPADGTLCTD